jgi:hypothetical protein
MSKLKVLDLFSGYTICEDGEITSRFGRVVKQQKSNVGYWRVELWTNGKGRKHSVHRLLAQAFLPNSEGKPHVNHIDGDKGNNCLSNLEWTTQSENQLHAYRTGLQVGFRKSVPISDDHKQALCGSRWKRETHVYSLSDKTFMNLWDASAHFGVSRQTILNRCKSERWPSWSKSKERR